MSDIFGITRVRNESLIIADTIEHFLRWCTHIVLFDDCSTDRTVEIAQHVGGDRITIIRGDRWRRDRTAEETRHRRIVLDRARSMGATWCLCFDADERLVGTLPDLRGVGFTFRLFDGYLTAERRVEYDRGNLAALPRMWGPEYRDILMLFRADAARYIGRDRREPMLRGSSSPSDVFVKHFGKCLSVAQWEQTCDYYATYFPERYRRKWHARKGRAIHTASDFGRALMTWHELMQREDTWTRI